MEAPTDRVEWLTSQQTCVALGRHVRVNEG
jgi:hypothetical protein